MHERVCQLDLPIELDNRGPKRIATRCNCIHEAGFGEATDQSVSTAHRDAELGSDLFNGPHWLFEREESKKLKRAIAHDRISLDEIFITAIILCVVLPQPRALQ